MSSGVFRGKESSNRIELSWLVQDLLNFGDLGSLHILGVGGQGCVDGEGGGWGSGLGDVIGVVGGTPPHTCTCTHMHTHTCMHGKHDNFMQMDCFHWIFWEFLGIPYDVIHVCAFMHMCVHMYGGTLSSPHTQSNNPQHPGGNPGISKNSIALELIKIFQFSLKIWNLWRLLHPWVGVWFGGLVDG